MLDELEEDSMEEHIALSPAVQSLWKKYVGFRNANLRTQDECENYVNENKSHLGLSDVFFLIGVISLLLSLAFLRSETCIVLIAVGFAVIAFSKMKQAELYHYHDLIIELTEKQRQARDALMHEVGREISESHHVFHVDSNALALSTSYGRIVLDGDDEKVFASVL